MSAAGRIVYLFLRLLTTLTIVFLQYALLLLNFIGNNNHISTLRCGLYFLLLLIVLTLGLSILTIPFDG